MIIMYRLCLYRQGIPRRVALGSFGEWRRTPSEEDEWHQIGILDIYGFERLQRPLAERFRAWRHGFNTGYIYIYVLYKIIRLVVSRQGLIYI